MLIEAGTLPVGVKYKDKIHKEYELRPQTGRDTVEAYGHSLSQTNDVYFSLVLLATRIEKLGDIPKQDITVDLILDATQIDIDELNKGARRLEKRLQTFSEDPAHGAASTGDTGADEDRLHGGADKPDA